mmetsp:Transcript_6311/g.11282  ORF Transcript_6311/g.11282 Transcript_6311/m.11282 type:complete len:226 (-) Transcript_6311:500-1177(-)
MLLDHLCLALLLGRLGCLQICDSLLGIFNALLSFLLDFGCQRTAVPKFRLHGGEELLLHLRKRLFLGHVHLADHFSNCDRCLCFVRSFLFLLRNFLLFLHPSSIHFLLHLSFSRQLFLLLLLLLLLHHLQLLLLLLLLLNFHPRLLLRLLNLLLPLLLLLLLLVKTALLPKLLLSVSSLSTLLLLKSLPLLLLLVSKLLLLWLLLSCRCNRKRWIHGSIIGHFPP